MKLLIVTCIKDYQENVQKIFKTIEIEVFSSVDITGFKGSNAINLLEEWFAAGDEKFDSTMFFSFTDDEQVTKAVKIIKEFNQKEASNFPVRAFILPVDSYI
ncbi:MAG TPA: hypothetical protein VMT76_12715 [Puia sp.]|nr:hypothetical protein [Puia sp.]